MNLAEAREHYLVVREKLASAREALLSVSKTIAKAERTLQKYAEEHASVVCVREGARNQLREAAAGVPSELAVELQSVFDLGRGDVYFETGAWSRFEQARADLLQANKAVTNIEHAKAEAEESLKQNESARAGAHVEFLKWQKNALKAAADVERYLRVEVAGMAPSTPSQEPDPEIDLEIDPPALSEPELVDCQNPQ